MKKILLQITLMIFGNLLAFLCVGLILDAIFQTNGKILLVSILVSLPILGLIMYLKAGKILTQLHNIPQKTDGKNNSDNA